MTRYAQLLRILARDPKVGPRQLELYRMLGAACGLLGPAEVPAETESDPETPEKPDD